MIVIVLRIDSIWVHHGIAGEPPAILKEIFARLSRDIHADKIPICSEIVDNRTFSGTRLRFILDHKAGMAVLVCLNRNTLPRT